MKQNLNIFGTNNKKFILPNETITILWDYKHIPNTQNKIIYIQVEPEAIFPQEKFLLENYNRFYKILTFNEAVLKKCKNSIMTLFCTCWINIDKNNFYTSNTDTHNILDNTF